MTQKLTNFEQILGSKMGFKMIPKTSPKRDQKLNPCFFIKLLLLIASLFFDSFFRHFWYPFWNPILGPDLPKKQQDEPKRAIRSFKDQKTAFSKPLKNTWFLHVFGSRGIPREPQETQEGSQEAPKELQNLKKN